MATWRSWMKMTDKEWLSRYPEQRLVCPHEDCPFEKQPEAKDCGNHEEWMT